MIVKFLNIKIENFKIIENLEIEFHDITKIYGANESGKTSVADAISWVLTGKNSLGDSTFNIVPVGSVGISPAVELKLSIDDKKPTLKRVLKAKIGRDKQFTGEYATECYVNGVKYTQRDFEKWIADNICDPEIFKLIHDVRYFTENISTNGKERPWEARRRLLTSICGIEHDKRLALLDERFKPISERLSEFDDSQQMMTWIKGEIATKERELNAVNNNIVAWNRAIKGVTSSIDEDAKEKHELVSALVKLEEKREKLLKEYDKAVEERNNKAYSLGQATVHACKTVSDLELKITNASLQLDRARETYEKYGISCPTCGRKFARGFSEQKKQEYESRRFSLQEYIYELKEKLEQEQKAQEAVEREYKEILASPKLERPVELDELEMRIAELREKISAIKTREKQRKMFDAEIHKSYKERDELSAKLSELQRDMDLTKDFIGFKMGIVSQKINSMFNGVEFVLFRQNKSNDDVRECCDVKFNGTDYHDLSYSTKFYCSLLIVMGFQKALSVEMPIICDNAESIDIPMEENDVQMIYLYKEDETCISCGATTGRKQMDGYWHCPKCGNSFKKGLKIC